MSEAKGLGLGATPEAARDEMVDQRHSLPAAHDRIDRVALQANAMVGKANDRIDALSETVSHLFEEATRAGGRVENMLAMINEYRADQQAGANSGSRIDQIEGQQRALDQAYGEMRAAVIQIGQRLDLVAREKWMSSYRTQALEYASKHRGPGDQPDTVIKYAKAFFDFLMEDLRAAEKAQAAQAEAQRRQSMRPPVPGGDDPEAIEDALNAAEFQEAWKLPKVH